MSDSGISWAICKSAPHSRQTTTPVPHHSVFYRPDALPAAQPTASKHWRQKHWRQFTIVHIVHYCSLFSIFDIILNHTYFWPAKVVAKLNYTTVAVLHMTHVDCKRNWVMTCWRDYLLEWEAYGFHMVQPMPLSLRHLLACLAAVFWTFASDTGLPGLSWILLFFLDHIACITQIRTSSTPVTCSMIFVSVCLSVCFAQYGHTGILCKNWQTDHKPVWVVNSWTQETAY